MITLGLEGTAHTLGVGLTSNDGLDFKVLADVRKMYQPKAGIHPREAAHFIGDNMRAALDEALEKAGLSFGNIDLISFSRGPGIGPCLRTVATAARTLSLYHGKPLVGVNHCVAHIEVGRVFCKMKDPVILYVSGANTQIIKLNESRYRVFGETLDIGAGNMLDKFGRDTGLEHPAGPKIEELARKSVKYVELPYVVKGMDLSFSGVLTSAVEKFRSGKESLEDLCFSLQETSFSMMAEVTERALAHLKANEILLTGGVGNNCRLQEMLGLMAEEHSVRFAVPKGFCGDNGVMIAVLGVLMHEAGVRHTLADSVVDQNFRTDDVDVVWSV